MADQRPRLLVLGTRGVPAAHGGFETFAERLALYLTARGWEVSIYCQHDVAGQARPVWTDRWNGIERINVEVAVGGPKGTILFDWLCIRDAARRPGTCLVLGYNTGVLLPWLRLFGRRVVTNMDGIEWRRAKWSAPLKAWFWANEWIAAWSSHSLVADHPSIADHLATRRSRDAIATIPYGGDAVLDAADAPVRSFGLDPDRYLVSVARIEPENNILEIVRAFSRREHGQKLAVLGTLDDAKPYHRAVKAAAGSDVRFLGAIYDAEVVGALRFHARAYLHGHSVGGTNPSLVEALWAGNAVIAHDNPFNRWTAGEAALFFADEDGCAAALDVVSSRDDIVIAARVAARRRAAQAFRWDDVLVAYERHILAVATPTVAVPLGRPSLEIE